MKLRKTFSLASGRGLVKQSRLFLNQNIFAPLLDLLIPQNLLVRKLEKLSPDQLFDLLPRSANLPDDRLKAMFCYKNPKCRQMIWEVKFRANPRIIKAMSHFLYEFIIAELSDLESFDNFRQPLLIPIPSSKVRLKEKGFNQCLLIGRELARVDKENGGKTFTLVENLLVKPKDTPHQVSIRNRSARLNNLKKSFRVNEYEAKKHHLHGRCIIVIDDVITTGATMTEALRALHEAGARKVIGVAIAH